jgi:glutaredoxin
VSNRRFTFSAWFFFLDEEPDQHLAAYMKTYLEDEVRQEGLTRNKMACPSCEVTVLDMHKTDVAKRAKSLGIRSVPAIVIDGKLADCCSGRDPDEATLRASGVRRPLKSLHRG